MAATNMLAPRYSTPELPMLLTNRLVSRGPTNAPAVPPAAMRPNRRLVCSLVRISSMKLQNTETSSRFMTLIPT